MDKRRTRFAVLCLLLLQITALSPFGSPVAFAQDQAPQVQPDAAAAPAALGIAHGAYLRPVFIDYGNGTWYSYGDELLAMNSLTGKDLAILMYFVSWTPFDPFLLDDIQKKVPQARQPVIMLTWEPNSGSTGCKLGFDDGQGPLRAINSGRCDVYIHEYARSLKARPERFILRLAHEMNIDDSPWWPGRWSQDASAYVAMYRHVRSIFRSEGVSNVEWMWSPNYASNPSTAGNNISDYYPGSGDVDWIGLSGYNWYSTRDQPWRDFASVYDGTLRYLASRYAKPVIIAEVGSVQGSNDTDKANWITDMYNRLSDYPNVRGVVWFDDFAYAQRGQPDFRITTGSADCAKYRDCEGVQALAGSAGQQATNAYVTCVRKSTFTSKLPSLSQATPAQPLPDLPHRVYLPSLRR